MTIKIGTYFIKCTGKWQFPRPQLHHGRLGFPSPAFAMILYDVYLSWLALAALLVVVAKGSNVDCTDASFDWVGTSVVSILSSSLTNIYHL